MPTYGTAIYGANTIRGRIDVMLREAQAQTVRIPALRVNLIQSQKNNWVLFAGSPLSNYGALHPASDHATSSSQAYYGYRLQARACILGNGTIVRVRVGDGTYANRNIYYQTITDPSVAAQWTSWSLLYSGTHFAVAIAPATSSTYNVYTAKTDGLYKNNVKTNNVSNIIEIQPVQGQTDAMFVARVFPDTDGQRKIELYYSSNILGVSFGDDAVNYRWWHTQISALKLSTGKVARAQTANFWGNPRKTSLNESLTISFSPSTTSITPETPPDIVRGFQGQAGSHQIANPLLVKLSDGFYYVFYSESRRDADDDVMLSSLTVFWQRSYNLIHWTEPVAIGFENMPYGGLSVFESGNYVYLTNNGAVYRRLKNDTLTDISNYVTGVSLEVPRGINPGSGTVEIANPANVNNFLLNATDQELRVEAGLKCGDGVYRYCQFGRWWIAGNQQNIERKVNRITLSLYDAIGRLDNPLRDIHNFVGQVKWNDWVSGAPQQLFNYYFKSCTATRVKMSNYYYVYVKNATDKTFVLYTGWKGHNGVVSARHRKKIDGAERWGIVYRYIDTKNYYWARCYGTTLSLVRVRNGAATTLASTSYTSTSPLRMMVDFKWGIHRIYINNVLKINHNETATGGAAPGYVGVRGYGEREFRFDSFRFTDWQLPVTTNDLVRTLLTMGDFHSMTVAAGTEPQLAVVWGPQTDLNTPAAAFRALAEQYKLNWAWRGTNLDVGLFKEKTVFGTVANEIIEFEQTETTGKRINLAAVDGKTDSYTAIDGTHSRKVGRQIVRYFDVPTLTTDSAVRARALEEVRKGVVGNQYSVKVPVFFNLWKMDNMTVVDHEGTSYDLRVEGFSVVLKPTEAPEQHMVLDMSPLT